MKVYLLLPNHKMAKRLVKLLVTAKVMWVVVALERVEEPTLSEQELAKFSTQLVRARQGELQGQLMQALREKAQIEINNTFIKSKMIQKKVRLTKLIEMSFIINF